ALLHARLIPGSGWNFGLLRRLGPQSRLTELVAIPDCPLHESSLNFRLMVLRTLIPLDAPLVFVQASGAILTLVLKCARNEEWIAWARSLEPALREAGVESLYLNWNPAAGRRALSARHQEKLFGPDLIWEGGFAHGALSFRQQIPEVEDAALDRAEEFLATAGISAAVDFYSGAGASLARWVKRGWRAAGVELVAEACRAAEVNAPGATVLKGRVEHRLPQLGEFISGAPFVLYTNPPRDGHAGEALAWIALSRPERIAYLSCNQRTLARDLQALAPFFEIESVQPFDFFPQTDHVESLALLRRKL
ncbi:MAG: hypothetical protein ACXVA8_12970, partial [Bdellovibrionota bacterium]